MSEDFVVPDFGSSESSGRHLAIICSKGNLDMAYPGLILANAALGEGVQVDLFFTFWGFDMIMRDRADEMAFSPAGNAAMRMGNVRMPQALAPAPGMTGLATRMLKKQIADLGIPTVPDFLEQIVASGGALWACKMSADMFHVTEEDLRDDLSGIINAATFIEMTDGAQILFI
ncbi:DsrE/DsrF/DrsH-like family protein [Cellulomonas citrea]|uniref:DsrE/DsrF/DrsH-like family protein n=1 Tax=Cellulomonas citrea TaxID=1909423 RepID=UPI00135795BC|nr:DsrE/DsrF/DrsH-like family protein [Cellulomonas citrea]